MDLGVLFAKTLVGTSLSSHRAASLSFRVALLFVLVLPISSTLPRIVATSAEFFAAFVDASVTHIRLANSITIGAAKGGGSWPLLLGRNCLVDATPGSAYARLDFNFAASDWVQLGPGVTLTFRGLVLSNVFSGSLLSLDFFAQSPPSSAIVWESVVDRRSICKPLQEIRDAWSNTPRPAIGSGPPPQQDQQQLAVIDGPNCNGDQGCYSVPVLRSSDVWMETPSGYQLRLNNTLMVCDQFISQACIQSLGGQLCYLNAVEELIARQKTGDSAAASSVSHSGVNPGARAGIIAGCVAGGVVLLLALLGVLLVCRSRRHARSAGTCGDAVAFSILDPTSGAGLAAFGSSGVGDTAPSNNSIIQQPHQHHQQPQQHHQQPQQHANVAKLLPGGKPALRGGAATADGRPSHDTTHSTDVRPSPGPAVLASAMESAGSGVSYPAGSQGPSGGLRPSGSGARDVPHSSSTATHTALSNQLAATMAAPHPQSSAGGGGSTTQSLGFFVMAMLRSVISRTGSRKQLHSDRSVASVSPAAAAGGVAGLAPRGSVGGSGGGSTHASAVGSWAGQGRLGGGGAARGGPPSLRSGTPGSARGSSAGQVMLTTAGSTRPSIGEIQQELERMEDQMMREQVRAAGGSKGPNSAASATRGRSPRTGGGGSGPPSDPQRLGGELQPAATPPSRRQ